MLRVLALEPYYALSHRTFLEGYARYSGHEVAIWQMPARKWKWRMRGSAYHFAEQARAASLGEAPHVVLASDFLNLADWLALAPSGFRDAPTVLYFHENQITFPLGEAAPADFHYGWINLSSAFAADRVLFNSSYHREAFLAEAKRVLDRMPDHVPSDLVPGIRERSEVFPVGIDFAPHGDALREPRQAHSVPTLVWNHRWEYDKGPELMAEILSQLKREGVPFRAVICGQSFKTSPPIFGELRERLGDHLVHLGFFESPEEYWKALGTADVVLSTSKHEFFGVSVVEAMFLGCLPVLPRALSYPELLPAHLHDTFLGDGPSGLRERLRDVLQRPPVEHRQAIQEAAAQYDWRVLAPRLDAILAEAAARGRR